MTVDIRENGRLSYSGMEQQVARWVHIPKVAGSSPASATNEFEMQGFCFMTNVFKLILPD